MAEAREEHDGTWEQEPIIESASATTSPDNKNSGPAAYVIAGVSAVLLILASYGLSSCASSLVGYALVSDMAYSDDMYDYDEYYDYDDEYYLDENDTSSTSGSLSVEEALSLELAAYDSYLDDSISAFDYAGASSDVSDYVRSLVNADSNAMDSLYATLRSAARDEDTRGESLAEALATCDAAIEAISAVEVPTSSSTDASDSLANGLQYTLGRWEALRSEVELLASSDEIDYSALVEADNLVLELTDEAGSALAEAMSLSAGN